MKLRWSLTILTALAGAIVMVYMARVSFVDPQASAAAPPPPVVQPPAPPAKPERLVSIFISDDLPTLERPMNAYSGRLGVGQRATCVLLTKKLASRITIVGLPIGRCGYKDALHYGCRPAGPGQLLPGAVS